MSAPMKRPHGVEFSDISEVMPKEFMSPIDRLSYESVSEWEEHTRDWSEARKAWFRTGVVYLPKFLPDDLIDAYSNAWMEHNRFAKDRPGGWPCDTPYLHVPELRRLSLYPPLMAVMKDLIGDDMGLHLNLTGWVSTSRDFHQDSYLNPEFVGSRYAAVWMALDKIHPDSGPFEFIPGSHHWPVIRQHKLFRYLEPQQMRDPAWPALTQEWVADVCLEEARARNAHVEIYTPERGDVLIWHSQLVHRGSPPKDPKLLRKALIAHYSSLSSRTDMPVRKKDENGENYFWFDHELK